MLCVAVCAQADDLEPLRERLLKWETTQQTDRITGAVTYAVHRSAEETVIRPQRYPPILDKVASLVIACEGGEARLFISVQGQLVAGNRNSVDYRIDDQTPVTSKEWLGSTDSAAVGLWTGFAAWPLINSLAKAKRLIFRNTHNVFGTFEAVFNTERLETSLKEVRQKCPHKPRR